MLSLTALLTAGCATASRSGASEPATPAAGTPSAGLPSAATSSSQPPAIVGWYARTDVRFVHTEVSDRKLAELLTGKMNSPVIHVPGLAKVPAEATSPVYIFANGVQPQRRGPLGFQGDCSPQHQATRTTRRCAPWCWSAGRTPLRLGS